MADDTLTAFLDAMNAAGIVPAEPIADKLGTGAIVHFQYQGDSKGRRNGWAKLHFDDRPAGAFGSHKSGVAQTWRSASTRLLSQAERQRIARECRVATARRWAASARAIVNRQIDRITCRRIDLGRAVIRPPVARDRERLGRRGGTIERLPADPR